MEFLISLGAMVVIIFAEFIIAHWTSLEGDKGNKIIEAMLFSSNVIMWVLIAFYLHYVR